MIRWRSAPRRHERAPKPLPGRLQGYGTRTRRRGLLSTTPCPCGRRETCSHSPGGTWAAARCGRRARREESQAAEKEGVFVLLIILMTAAHYYRISLVAFTKHQNASKKINRIRSLLDH